jgi:anti-anti-sigma regulatory factor
VDDAQDENGQPDGPRDGSDEEIAADRMRTRALVPQPPAATAGTAARPAPSTALAVDRDALDAALVLLVTVARSVVFGADGVSLTLPRNGHPATVAASDEELLELDHQQDANGAGPSLDATRGERVHVESLHSETRWPAFVRTARARGVQTVLSLPLGTADRPVGALTVYSRTAGALAGEEAEWAELIAAEASGLLRAGPSGGPDGPVGLRVREALQFREAIAHAQGVIMHRDGVSSTAASAVLRDISRRTGQALREVAADCVASYRHGDVLAAAVAAPPREVLGPPTVDVSPRQPDGTIYLTVGGAWTRAAAGGTRALFDGVRRHRPTLVIVDLADVTVMDARGVEALATASSSLQAAGCRVELHNPPPALRSLLEGTDGRHSTG